MSSPFTPEFLPPRIDYEILYRKIISANVALAQLSGLMTNMPSHELLTLPLLNREAVLSSQIGGSQATLMDVYLYEAGAGRPGQVQGENDIMEAINLKAALSHTAAGLGSEPVSGERLIGLRDAVLSSPPGGPGETGEYRKGQAYVAPPGSGIDEATFVPPAPEDVPSLMDNWCEYVNNRSEDDDLVMIGVAHYQFEAIHPFTDCNGRIGRLLIPALMSIKGLLPRPALHMSDYLEHNRKQYLRALHEVDTTGDLTGWLLFFLDAVEVQSKRTGEMMSEIAALHADMAERVKGIGSRYAAALLDTLFESPCVTFGLLKTRLAPAASQTIYNLLDSFTSAGVIERLCPAAGHGRMTYIFRRLTEVLR